MEELGSLVERAQRGELDAYAEVVRRFQDMAFGYSFAMLGDFHLAQDAAQEAFIEAYRQLAALREPSAFPGWFRRIVFKHCDRLTRRKPLGLLPLDAAGGVASVELGPAESAERREMRNAVLTAIRSMPDRERTVTALFYINGYSQKDIAEFLEVPVSTVDGRLRTARRGLKERMLSMVGETLKSFVLPERFADVVEQMTFVIRRINPLADGLRSLTDAQLLARSGPLRRRLAAGEGRSSIKAEGFALVREACRRAWNMPLYDVQLVAGLIIDQGWVAEVASGEGKTIACLPGAYMGVLEGKHVHVAVLSDSLARRDADFAEGVFSRLGVTVGCLASEEGGGKQGRQARRRAYEADVTYGWNLAFGFDFLLDGMRGPAGEKVQGPLDYAIVDEADAVLIDEARTPLIVSGHAETDTGAYGRADEIARTLISMGSGERTTELYAVDRENTYCIRLTSEGRAAAEALCGVGSLGAEPNVRWTSLIEQALRAHLAYQRDREYIVRDGKVVIVDESTGRPNPGREWSDGLHQAVECKEGLEIRAETKEEASARLQDYFRLYGKLAGVTGTAKQQAAWFRDAYGMDVAVVPTRYPANRVDHEDRVFPGASAKREAVIEEVRHYCCDLRRPVLIGTRHIRETEELSDMLGWRGIRHDVLNARVEDPAREAEILASAGGRLPGTDDTGGAAGAVTIATSIAGRGIAIELSPAVIYASCKVPSAAALAQLGVEPETLFPEGATKCCINCPEFGEASRCAHCFKPRIDAEFPHRGRTGCRKEPPCGLHVVGVGRAMTRRLDDQLRARSGRQGEPGSSRFFLSLEDEVMRSALEELKAQGNTLGWDEHGAEGRRISEAVQRAQRQAEEKGFQIMRALDGARPTSGSQGPAPGETAM